MRRTNFNIILILVGIIIFNGCQSDNESNTRFSSSWANQNLDRPWGGPDYWLNPLQSWKQSDGKMHCLVSGGDRNIVLLTQEINESSESFETKVTISPSSKTADNQVDDQSADQSLTDGNYPAGLHSVGWVGFQIGLKGHFQDYRDDAVKGIGLSAGLTKDSRLFIGDLSDSKESSVSLDQEVQLSLYAQPKAGSDEYSVRIEARVDGSADADYHEASVHKSWMPGLMALTCSQSVPDTINRTQLRPAYFDLKELNKRVGGDTYFAFENWTASGGKLTSTPERAYGPILWTQYTLTNDILKMSVQMAPVGNDHREVILNVEGEEVARSNIDQLGRNALFRLEDWNSQQDHSYTITYDSKEGQSYIHEGVIQHNKATEDLKVASLSCVDDRGFPHQDIVDHVGDHEPDLLLFHGDQLYERVAGYGVERNSILDYQRKWYVFGWSFGELLSNIPSVIIPDDHDVFHGNLWGEGGKAADVSLGYGYDGQDSGGYKEPPEFVNMVHRTQTGHLPDPTDPTPVKQDISVYYTNMDYRGVSFAILGDRQWKSAPKRFLPDAAIENGWPQNKTWNAKTEAYHPEAELLGSRQEAFLEGWITQWSPDVRFKAVVSQSPFCNVATLPAHIYHDKYVPGLPRYKKGEYPSDDRPVADFDSNGWPQNKRNLALKIIRKSFAIHLTGDQHLGSTGQYGVDEHGDAGYWNSTPAVSNLWPRRWFPAKPGNGGKDEGDTRRYSGNYEDGFGNNITVKGIANPYDIDRNPSMVFDKAPGYSIIQFDSNTRQIKMEVWPRWASPERPAPDNVPFEDWPIVIDQMDNYRPINHFPLSEIEVTGKDLVEVINEESGELLYNLRPKEGIFVPWVDDESGSYTLRITNNSGEVTENRGLSSSQ